MTSPMRRLTLDSKRRSRLVRIPTRRPSLLPSSVMGTPEMRYCCIRSSASNIRLVAASVIGFTIMPLSERLTRSTSLACSSMERFLWMTPMPPCCAIAMASPDSVTVSIAALSSGTLRRMFRVSRVETSTCVGSTVECCGTSRTSSKVRAVISIVVRLPNTQRADSMSALDCSRASSVALLVFLSAATRAGVVAAHPWAVVADCRDDVVPAGARGLRRPAG